MKVRAATGWRSRLLGSTFSLAILLIGHGQLASLAQSQPEPSPGFFFSHQGSLDLSAGQTTVKLVNNLARAVTLRIVPTMSSTENRSASVAVEPNEVTIDPGLDKTITVTPTAEAGPAALDVAGALIAFEPGTPEADRRVVRLPVRLRLPPREDPRPLVKEWSVTSYRQWPWDDRLHNEALPLSSAASCEALALPTDRLGAVSSATGGGAEVRGSCEKPHPWLETSAIELVFPGIDHHSGDYKGTIDLLPADDKAGEVVLTVRRTDAPHLPLAVLAAGVLSAVFALRWQDGGRRVSELIERTIRAEAAATRAQSDFRAASLGQPWAGYSIVEPIAAEGASLRSDLRWVRARTFGNPETDETFKRTVTRIGAIESLVQGWPALATKISDLDFQVRSVQSAADRVAIAGRDDPRIVAWLATPLRGRAVTVDEAIALGAVIDSRTATAQVWERLATLVSDARNSYAPLSQADRSSWPAPLVTEFSSLAGALYAVADELFTVIDDKEMATRNTAADVDAVVARVNALRAQVPLDLGESDTKSRGITAYAEAVLGMSVIGGGGRLEPAPSSAALADEIATTRQLWDRVLLVLLTALALWAGLAALYFDKPFGTPRDYFTIFAWGFGAPVAVTTLGRAVASAGVSGRSPVRPSARL